MTKLYTLSPESVPENQVLFPTIRPEFEKAGHEFTHKPYQADIILIDLHTRVAEYSQDDIDYIIDSGKPICTWDEFDKGGMSDLDWPQPLTGQQFKIFEHLNYSGTKAVHFCRLLNKTKTDYPTNLYPYEKPILFEQPMCSPDELFNRPVDIFFVANDSPNRQLIKKAFEEDGRFKCNIVLGVQKIPFNDWLDQCRQAKFFIKASAGGYGCERMQALFSISPMLLERTNQLFANPFTDWDNCITFGQPPNKTDLDVIYAVLNNKENLWRMYYNNYNFVKTYYSKEFWGNYYLGKMKKHGIIC